MDRLALTCEQIARWNSRGKKVRILSEYLRELGDADLQRAVRFLCCGPIPRQDRKFAAGGATLREALRLASGWDAETISACHSEVGDTGETVGHLMRGISAGEPMSLMDAELLYARLFKQRNVAGRAELLKEIYLQRRPETLKFFVKVITGNLRIGLQTKMVEESLAAATGTELEDVRMASNRAGDLAQVALAARRGRLHEIEARLFHPMEFMLAKPLESIEDIQEPGEWLVEDKYDGFRAHAHVTDRRVALFTRGMEDVTAAFPDVVEAFRSCPVPAVFDGEILAWRDGRALPFPVLQQRIARKKRSLEFVASIPVIFMGYDLLYSDSKMLVSEPIEVRRRMLEEIAGGLGIHVAPQWSAGTPGEIDRDFGSARERGNEGLLLKRRGSVYEPGKRSGAWTKLKRPHGTLDVVVTAAEQGSGRRAIYLSDYTFAVRDGDRFVNVGKAYSGLTDQEVRQLTRILRGLATDKFGKVVLVEPKIILEVAFDGVQKSARHKGGFALRFPRILQWRRDKSAEDADTIDRVAELYEVALAGCTHPIV